jgi:signal peptidase I
VRRALLVVVLAVLALLVAERWLARPYRVASASMEPTLHCGRPAPGCLAGTGDVVLVDRLVRRPARGQIVAARAPAAARRRCGSGGTLIKRVVGLPGETLIERDGFVFVGGHRLREPYLDLFRRDHAPARTWHVPGGAYFLLGDDRANSCDSRAFGAVPRAAILGRAVAVVWPPGRVRGL